MPQAQRPALPPLGAEVPDAFHGLPPIGGEVRQAAPVSRQREMPVPQGSTGGRVVSGAWTALQAMGGMAAKASGVPGLFRAGVPGAVKDQFEVAKGLFYDPPRDLFEKARTATTIPKMVAYGAAGAVPVVGPMGAHIAESVADRRVPELIGEGLAGLAVPGGFKAASVAASGAKSALAARAARGLPKALQAADDSLRLAFPKAKPESIKTARPYINEQLGGKAPTTQELFDALNKSSGQIHAKVRGLLEEFPDDVIEPRVTRRVVAGVSGRQREGFADAALREMDRYDIDRPRRLVELDDLRDELNAANQTVMDAPGTKRANVRKTNPEFAAREIAVDVIRERLYGHMEQRGVPGVAQLRRDQGAVIQFKKAVESQLLRGANKVTGSSTAGAVRQAAAAVVGQALPLPGIVTQPIARVLKGGRSTRDALVAKAFNTGDKRVPTYPTVPPRPTGMTVARPRVIIEGEVVPPPPPSYVDAEIIPPAQLRAGFPPRRAREGQPSPDTSGPIAPTLPENILNERRVMPDRPPELVPSPSAAPPVVPPVPVAAPVAREMSRAEAREFLSRDPGRAISGEELLKILDVATDGRLKPVPDPVSVPSAPKGALAQLRAKEQSADAATLARADQASVASSERSFMLRHYADDLRELEFQPEARMGGQHLVDTMTEATSQEAGRRASYAPRVAGTPTQEMFHAVGIKGSRREIADQLDRAMQGKKVNPKIDMLVEAMREAWDGQRFDWQLVSDDIVAKLGIRRRDFRSPSTMPDPNDLPDTYERLFGGRK